MCNSALIISSLLSFFAFDLCWTLIGPQMSFDTDYSSFHDWLGRRLKVRLKDGLMGGRQQALIYSSSDKILLAKFLLCLFSSSSVIWDLSFSRRSNSANALLTFVKVFGHLLSCLADGVTCSGCKVKKIASLQSGDRDP